jgi:hypothetical protein
MQFNEKKFAKKRASSNNKVVVMSECYPRTT